ncbi:hypothetical protein PJ900_17345 [Tistrella mobilis]|uniref:EAL domain-containing protein n=1 Tax=Tistrella mobilis TaxID=171437 RepID=A0A162KDE2_9PROT|nr:hypothetical protein [Tistrella mobilis]KYO50999.1 hypothetical protein AUP44_10765 [Tistrella mobilis]
MDLLHWVRDLLTHDDAATSPSPVRRDSAAADPPADEAERLEDIRHRVDLEVARLLKARPAAMAGRVVRLSLEPIADRLGDKWPQSAGRVRTAAGAILGRRLGDSAVILPHGPLELIAIAPERTPAAALSAAAGAAAEITRFAFGGDDAGPWPAVSVADGLAGEEPRFTAIALKQLVAELSRPAAPAAPPPTSAPPAPAPASPPQAAAPAVIPAPVTIPDLESLVDSGARAVLGPLWRPAGDHPAQAASEDVSGQAGEDVPAQLDCDYRPVVSLVHGKVAAGLLRPRLMRGAAMVRGYAVLGPQADAVDIGQLDLYCLHRAITDIVEARRHGLAVFVTLAVHFETLAPTGRRMIYAGRLAAVADQSGARIAPEIVGCPPDVAPALLEAMVAPIRPHCRMVLMRVKVDHRRFDAPAAAGIRRIGIHLGRHADGAARKASGLVTGALTPEAQVSPQALTALGTAVRRAGMRLHTLGIDDDARLDMAAAAGADLVAGEAIGATTAAPPVIGVARTPG